MPEILDSPSRVAVAQLPAGVKVNLGCGPVQPADWVNVDGSHRARLAAKLPWLDKLLTRLRLLPASEFSSGRVHYCNLLKHFPVADGAAAAIYAGELWEHFELDDARRVTAACFRALRPNGVLRICVPDGVQFWQEYLRIFADQRDLPRRERSATQLERHVAMYFGDICTRRMWLGSIGHKHKWQYDEFQLVELLERAGFTAVERMPFHVSRIPDIQQVERSDFLIVEGVRP